jgi:hypothetical protein
MKLHVVHICYGILVWYEHAHVAVIYQEEEFRRSNGPFANFLNGDFGMFI